MKIPLHEHRNLDIQTRYIQMLREKPMLSHHQICLVLSVEFDLTRVRISQIVGETPPITWQAGPLLPPVTEAGATMVVNGRVYLLPTHPRAGEPETRVTITYSDETGEVTVHGAKPL